jgi:hypothetical protein
VGRWLAARGWRLATRRSCLAILIVSGVAAPAQASLTEGPRLAALYDSLLNAQFDGVDAQLKRVCPPAPAEACQVLEVVSRWWQIQVNPDHPDRRQQDQRFLERATAATTAAEAWTKREPKRAEAWFYLAASYAPLVQWQVLQRERLAAARNASRIRAALLRTLELDATIADAHFGIGLYEYYADVAPAAAKMLRWLLFLPGGDRAHGLQEMLRARNDGEILRGEADYQLQLIYVWYEHEPGRAIDLLKSLDARYPENPLFLQRIAETYDTYLHDARASAVAWKTLVDRARNNRVYDASQTAARAEMKLRALTARQ